MQTPYKFSITSGLVGCFMPNYVNGPYIASTRKELGAILRDELEMLDYPANRIHNFEIARMWGHIQAAGSGSSVHSSCDSHNGEHLEIHGLTDSECEEMESANDY